MAGDGALEPVTTRGEFGELLYEAPPRRAAAARSASVLGELGTDNFAERPRHDSTPPQLVRPADDHHLRACIDSHAPTLMHVSMLLTDLGALTPAAVADELLQLRLRSDVAN